MKTDMSPHHPRIKPVKVVNRVYKTQYKLFVIQLALDHAGAVIANG